MKNLIKVNHSSITINNYELGDSKILENTFSIWDQRTFTKFKKGIYYDEENKLLYVPRGIDITWLERLFPSYKVEMETNSDEYDSIGEVKIKYLPRDERQEEALKFLVGIDKYKHNKYKSQLALNLNTGVGKTYCSITAVSYIGLRPIMITYSLNWIKQWKEFILEYTDIQPKEIFIINGIGSIYRLLNKKDMSGIKFLLATHATIKSYGDNYGWDKVRELFKKIKVGIKIFDECHLNFDNMCMIDFFSNTRQTFYVSATPSRSDDKENVIYQYYFRNIPSIDLFDKENDPRTAYMAIRYKSNPTPDQISKCKNKYGLDRNAYTNYVVHQENFYKILKIILNIVLKGNKKTLFFIGTNSAIDVVCDWMKTNYPKLSNQIGIFNSTVMENKQEQLNKQIILTTTKSCGAAVDIKGLQVVVVLAEPFKSEVLARQTLGRCRDKNTTYIELVDDSFVYIRRFYYAKQKIFEKYATECTEIKFTNEELEEKSSAIINTYQNKPTPGIIYYREYKAKPNSGIVYYEEITP